MRMPCGLHVGGKNNKLYSLRRWKNGLGYNSRKVENAWKDFDKSWTLTTAGGGGCERLLGRAARAIRFSLERGDRTVDECEK